MSIANELQKLQELHRGGALSDEEFAAAKAAVIATGSGIGRTTDSALQEQVEELQRQQAITRLDREWEVEQEQYMAYGRYGGRFTPSRGGSLFGGAIIVVMGIAFMSLCWNSSPLIGVMFVLFGVGITIYSDSRARQYERAQQKYRRRRARLLAGQPDEDDVAIPVATPLTEPARIVSAEVSLPKYPSA